MIKVICIVVCLLLGSGLIMFAALAWGPHATVTVMELPLSREAGLR